jgi:UDPglucose 6-dehydrogenase
MTEMCVIGSGYVGLVTGTCFAELGNHVICVDADGEKILQLKAGAVPFYEPGLAELISRNVRDGRLEFTSSTADAVRRSLVVFLAVGTPPGPDGDADLSQVRDAAVAIARALNGPKIVVNKSTVPVETADMVASTIREHRTANHEVRVISNPEFVREGSAIADFMTPDRIVIGVSDEESARVMRELYAPLKAPLFITDNRTAEMIKYTANAFLAMKISFANEIARICHHVGAEIKDVILGAGSDKRIGFDFLNAGLGFGGSCFPKDVLALQRIAEAHGVDPILLISVLAVNESQIEWSFKRLELALDDVAGKKVGVLGLAFKPNTDDVRESPAIALIERLLAAGATIAAHDPVALENARRQLGDRITYVSSSYEAANDADAIVVATDWNEYKQIDFGVLRKLMNRRVILDGRNLYDAERVEEAGFTYLGFGRRSTRPAVDTSWMTIV